ncbi:MAG TPA: GNAT family protein [Tepidisphaeraceae bacterium]
MPILLDIPMPIVTDHLLIRESRAGEGRAINEAVAESFTELHRWMPWAKSMPSVEESESFSRETAAKFLTRKDFGLRVWSPDGQRLWGAAGLHPQNWDARSFEIGYWIRTSEAGKGLMTEAVVALTAYAFKHLDAGRIQIRCDSGNTASRRVAEKSGYVLEGTHRRDCVNNEGTLRDTCVYARLRD